MIAKIRGQRHDAIGIFLLNDQVISYYRQALTLRFTLPTFGASIHDSQELIDRAGPGAEGALLVGYDVTPDFRARWLGALKSDARTGCGANAYDTARMIAELFGDGSRAGLPASVIAGRFASISRRHGVSGEFGFAETSDGGKHFDFPISARVIRNGKIERSR
jgi:hypothetical protein